MSNVEKLLGRDANYLLNHKCKTIASSDLHLPGPDFVDRIFSLSDRSNRVLGSLEWLFQHGRLAGTGYLSILPVDQGIEHSAGASFAPNPIYFDPENIVKLAIEGGCNGVASTLGVLGSVSRKYAHKIPFIVKINHNELLTYPEKYDQRLFASVDQAFDMGAAAVGAGLFVASSSACLGPQEVRITIAVSNPKPIVLTGPPLLLLPSTLGSFKSSSPWGESFPSSPPPCPDIESTIPLYTLSITPIKAGATTVGGTSNSILPSTSLRAVLTELSSL